MLHRGKAALRVLPQLHSCLAAAQHTASAITYRCFAAQAEPLEDTTGCGLFMPKYLAVACFLASWIASKLHTITPQMTK